MSQKTSKAQIIFQNFLTDAMKSYRFYSTVKKLRMNKVLSYGNAHGVFVNARRWKNNFCLLINRQLK